MIGCHDLSLDFTGHGEDFLITLSAVLAALNGEDTSVIKTPLMPKAATNPFALFHFL
jgi:hypothetical protein